MIFKNGESCPVCDKKFNEEDDIVICPLCGTPHHRQCYSRLGKCANADKHKSGYEYNSGNSAHNGIQEQQEKSNTEKENFQSNEALNRYFLNPESAEKSETVKCGKCGAENRSTSAFCSECGERLTVDEKTVVGRAQEVYASASQEQYRNSREEIDGKSVSDIASVVVSNTKRFIPKFKRNKALSWNWGAFFFGPYYYMFRKMYKEGIIIMAVRLAVNLIVQGIYTEEYTAFMNFVSSHKEVLTNPTEELLNQLMPYYQAVLPMILILSAVGLVINIFCALFADKFYRSKVFGILNKVDSNLEEGGSFGQNPLFEMNTELSQEQMKTLYLNKLGGISFFAPVLAYLVLDILSSFISKL
ncbi:MAG: RING finger protein [Eubacterium sp.]